MANHLMHVIWTDPDSAEKHVGFIEDYDWAKAKESPDEKMSLYTMDERNFLIPVSIKDVARIDGR